MLAFQKGVVVSSSSAKEQEDYDRRFQESTNAGLMLNGNRAPRGGDSPTGREVELDFELGLHDV